MPNMTPSELAAYYTDLLIVQYRALPKARATISLLSAQLIADLIYTQVQNAFNLDTAIGKQLDVLGAYVGARRVVGGYTPTLGFWQLPDYADGPTGYGGLADYSDVTDPMDYWKLYTYSGSAYVLSDGQLSLLIQYMIAVHASDYTNASIDLILQQFFGVYAKLTDNADMTLTYTHYSTDPNIFFDIVNYLGLLPRPAGVGVTVVII